MKIVIICEESGIIREAFRARGHDASKNTALYLKGLPPLIGTKFIPASHPGKNGKLVWANQTPSGQNKLGPSADRKRLRSETYSGIADAMGEQWG